MIVKNLLEPSVRTEIIDRLHKLSPHAQALWGKMTVAQMLAHCQAQIGVGLGTHAVSRSLAGKLFGHFVKSILYNDKPFKRSLPTDRTFIVKEEKQFEKERASLIEMVSRFRQENLTGKPHPFFGKLTPEQWGKGTWKHLDHHLQQFGA